MGKTKVRVLVRSWGLSPMPDMLTVDADEGVSEASFQVRMMR